VNLLKYFFELDTPHRDMLNQIFNCSVDSLTIPSDYPQKILTMGRVKTCILGIDKINYPKFSTNGCEYLSTYIAPYPHNIYTYVPIEYGHIHKEGKSNGAVYQLDDKQHNEALRQQHRNKRMKLKYSIRVKITMQRDDFRPKII
jgi:hypothetical protein